MHARTKILIDRCAGLPLAWAGNIAARILGKVMRRDHSMTARNVRTIVLAKYVGMGSIIQATPLIRSVRRRYPEARIIFLTGANCKALVERVDDVDEILTVDDGSVSRILFSSLRAVAYLIRSKVDIFFDLEVYSAYASIVALLSLSRNRIGFFRGSAGHKRGNYTHLAYFNTHQAIRSIYLQLGRLALCEPIAPERLASLRVEESDRAELRERLERAGAETGGYIAVNPNASDLMLERRWPQERFVECIEEIVRRTGFRIVLLGSPPERPYVDALVDRLSPEYAPSVINLCGALSIGGLLALLEGARCVVTNDSGPMHMAWSLGRPTVGLFGPASPEHYGWHADNCRIVYRRTYCSPCVHEVDQPPCRGDNVCMKRIEVSAVVRAIEDLLHEIAMPAPVPPEYIFFVDDAMGPLGRVTRDAG